MVEALVEKKLVVVALVPVALVNWKLVRVLEAVDKKPLRRPTVVEVETPQAVGVQAKAPLPS